MTEFYDREKIYTGEQLRQYVSKVAGFKKRDCYAELQKFLQHTKSKMIFSFCGLRRTGKSTMLAQAICDMSPDQFEKACFIAAEQYKDMDELYHDIDQLYQQGYEYFFIDEITALPDFISRSAFLANKYGWLGKKVVLTGTDSLSFVLANGDSLFGRQDLVRTSYIPYHEFRCIIGEQCDKPDLNKKDKKDKEKDNVYGIDLYISYGGALVPESPDGNPDFSKSPFATRAAIGEYLDTAISGNILHSLQHDDSIQNEHSPLRELDKEGRLQSIINRIVAYHNERITLEHLSDAEGHLSMSNLSFIFNLIFGDKQAYRTGLDQSENIETLIEPIRTIAEEYFQLLNISEDSLDKGVTKAQIDEIEKYLDKIGLLRTINVETYRIKRDMAGDRQMEDKNPVSRTGNLVIVQPGMQYCIANVLVGVIDKHASELFEAVNQRCPASHKIQGKVFEGKLNNILQTTRNKVRGNILESIVLVEAAAAAKKLNGIEFIEQTRTYKMILKTNIYEKLSNNGENNKHKFCNHREVDLVVEDRTCGTIRLFEVKHNDDIVKDQYKNLLDPDLHWIVEDHYGKQIVQRTVLYRGPSKALDNGVIYYNVEDFLCKLGEDPNFLVCDLKAEIERKQRGAELAQQEAVLKTERYPESEHETKLELDNVGDWTEDSCIEDTDIYNETDWCER